jgi:hypothetical protein
MGLSSMGGNMSGDMASILKGYVQAGIIGGDPTLLQGAAAGDLAGAKAKRDDAVISGMVDNLRQAAAAQQMGADAAERQQLIMQAQAQLGRELNDAEKQRLETARGLVHAVQEEKTLRDAIKGLSLSDLSTRSDAEKLATLRSQVDEDVRKASAGDHEAIARLPGDVTAQLSASLAYNGRATPAYLTDYNAGVAILNRFADSAAAQAADLPKFALGGRPPVGRAYLVGERGPEIRVDDVAGSVLPNSSLGDLADALDGSGDKVVGAVNGLRRDLARSNQIFRSMLALAQGARRRTAA